jgi:hypothetical protein
MSLARTTGWLVAMIGLSQVATNPAPAFQIDIADDAFASQTNDFSNVTSFQISIEVVAPLAPGLYSNPALGDIEFLVAGGLDPATPARMANSAFTAFAVDDRAALSGQDFYDQGNALAFEIAESAILSDGIQVSELVGSGLVFEFDGRELGTGRYHPPILQLFADGTGLLRNSNNTGGINPFTGVEVNATIGDEYVTRLTFDPTSMTVVVPEPSTALLMAIGLAGLAAQRREHARD